MRGLMQERPLLISSLIEYAERYHGDTEIVSRTVEGPLHRYNYAAAHQRCKKLGNALLHLGVKRGDRVATMAWNGYRHLEVYYAVSGIGGVLHTINPRLFADQIVYIANHAEDTYLFVDLTFVPLLEQCADRLRTIRGHVIMTDREHMPDTTLPNALCFEELLAGEDAQLAWPTFDENTASSLCYTSGTTGNPKGVLYSHRSTVLHSFSVCMRDGLGLSSRDTVLPIVPMFHVNAWGLVYAAPMCGAKLVLPGAGIDGKSLYELVDRERVTFTGGVPTIWFTLLGYLQANNLKLPHLERTVIGGSAAPRSIIETLDRDYGVTVVHAWGMTEMSPLGTVGNMTRNLAAAPLEERIGYHLKQGRAVYGVELKITDDDGRELPRDGKAFGHLKVRGPWVTRGYFRGEGGDILDEDSWLDTGDVATLDNGGFMQITDRAKDIVKSGGEWISSIDLENIAVGHPEVAEAAVIGIPHPKWGERPLLLVVRKAGSQVQEAAIREYLAPRVAKWWLPDAVVFVAELPHTATGKLHKLRLREQFRDYKLPA